MAVASQSTVVSGGTAQGIIGAQTATVETLTIYNYYGSAPPREPKPEQAGAAPLPLCPYPGLSYFGPEQSQVFYGRDRAIARLIEAIPTHGLTALVGASGSGKSSVVLAGLAPQLAAGEGWIFSYFRIATELDKNPFAALARAVVPLIAPGEDEIDKSRKVARLAAALEAGEDTLANVLSGCRRKNPRKRVLLIADQFEEIFTLAPDEDRRARFIDVLLSGFGMQQDGVQPDACLILTLRADFYNMALRHRPLSDALQGHVENLGPMTRDELREAIEKPAGDLAFEGGLIETLLDDVANRPGNLPLLQFALRELWLRQENGCLTHAAYQAIGQVEGALAKRAEDIFNKLTKAGKDDASVSLFRRLFTRLVAPGKGVEDTRRVVDRGELGDDAWRLAQRLAGEENRLLVTSILDRAPTSERGVGPPLTNESGETVEVVHEALIRNWPTLVDWINRDRELLSWLEQLKPRVDQWRINPNDEGTLIRGSVLAVARDWLKRRRDELTDEEQAFIVASISAKEAEERSQEEIRRQELERQRELAREQRERAAIAEKLAEEQRERASIAERLAEERAERAKAEIAAAAARRRSSRLTFLSLATIVFTALAGFAVFQWVRAAEERQSAINAQREAQAASNEAEKLREQVRITQSLFLADLARQQLDAGDYGTAIALSLEALPDAKGDPSRAYVPEAEQVLFEAVGSLREKRVLSGHENSVSYATFSPDGRVIATAAGDNTARLWDAATGAELLVMRGHKDWLNSIAFSPDGGTLATASDDGAARLWDAKTGVELGVLSGHTGWVTSAVFSPDGKSILTASADSTARLWDVDTRTARTVLRGHETSLYFARFSPDGATVATASRDMTARLWDAATGAQRMVLRGHDGDVNSAAFSPDGRKVVTASSDNTARVWDAGTGAELLVLQGHESTVYSAVFSPDGATIATASWDPSARLWDAATGVEIAALRGHGSDIGSVVFSPDGKTILTASDDKTARLWDRDVRIGRTEFQGHEGTVNSAAFSPDGAALVTSSADSTARVWDVATASERAVLRGHQGEVASAAFSPQGATVLTASDDKTARLWDAETGAERLALRGHDGPVASAGFSPDGTVVVTASSDGTARLWNAATGSERAVLRGHEGAVGSAAFSPDGTTIVTASKDYTARLWDAATGVERLALRGHEGSVASAAFSPDGGTIVTASSDNTARLWDAASGAQRATLSGHEDAVRSAAFSADGAIVVTASDDGTARLWDAATGAERGVLRGDGGQVSSAVFAPDGATIVTSANEKARLWRIFHETQTLIDYAKSIMPHALTSEQRRQFFLDRAPGRPG